MNINEIMANSFDGIIHEVEHHSVTEITDESISNNYHSITVHGVMIGYLDSVAKTASEMATKTAIYYHIPIKVNLYLDNNPFQMVEILGGDSTFRIYLEVVE